MKGLTSRQLEILEYIEKYISVHHFPPSFRELQKSFSFSSLGTVSNLVRSLKRKGALQANSKLIPTKESKVISVPLIGNVQGGGPIKMHQEARSIPLSRELVDEVGYLLEVKEGFEEEGLFSGDLLVVEPRKAEEGDLVIALIAKSYAHIGRFHEKELIELEGRSQTLRFRDEHIDIVGVVTLLLRYFVN